MSVSSRLGLAQDASLDELRALPAESLLELPEGNPYIDFVTCDGIVLKDASARDGLLRGACREIPILCGCNLGEGEYPTPAGKDAFYAGFRERLGDLCTIHTALRRLYRQTIPPLPLWRAGLRPTA